MNVQPRTIERLKPGQPFRTLLTKRRGLTLEGNRTSSEGILVQMLDPAEEKRLAPAVLVEPRDEMEDDR